MQPALHTRPQSGNAHEHKSTKALAARLSTVHNTAAAIFSLYFDETMRFVGRFHGPGLILAGSLAQICG